ncbi:MAG: ABC transporter permease [Kiritimatiellaeota bacterium]|nr:ABC transporter permease [Kiritimatiellota bacterium]
MSVSFYGHGVVCFKLKDDFLSCEAAASAFGFIKSYIVHNAEMREYVLDVESLRKADPLAMSLLPAMKNLCLERRKEFYVSGLSDSIRDEIVKHSSFKGKYLPAITRGYHTLSERIERLGGMGIDFGKHLLSLINHTGDFAFEVFQAIRHPSKIRWRETLYYMDICGADALPIVSVICFLMGLILGFQGALQLQKIGTDIYLADGVGLSIVKELGPLMVAMIATGRAGSAFAAEIGTMKVGEEINALTTFGFVPSRFLFIPKLLAMVVVMPLLTVFGDFIGIAGGMAVGHFKLGIPITPYVNRTLYALQNIHLAESLAKGVVFAILITIVGCVKGFESDGDAQGVGRSATSAVVTSIFLIVVADTVITYLFS